MSKKLINLALMHTDASKYSFGTLSPRLDILKGIDKQKCQPKHEFVIKDIKIMAASKKNVIKKFNYRKK